MRGIYIPDMEMPKACKHCPLRKRVFNECYNGAIITDALNAQRRRNDCPLVEVPTHGRLIDADELLKKVREKADFPSEEWCKAIECIENAPTILEASE